jgi:DNA-binding response OmpR family regulator
MDILLYTNDALLSDVLRIAFGGAYRVRLATTERRLFSTLASGRISAVLLDASQGDADMLCARLHDFSDAALIAIARTDETADRVRLLRAGADEVLSHSFTLAELAARVQAKLRRSPPPRRRLAA